ncbi:MAG: hypothetical protein E6Q24_00045 [Chitinophagaceae bacterium]|nr:MAG: hypothetical protein E6Q24_00045 [Chitinophagaceae bacterium]
MRCRFLVLFAISSLLSFSAFSQAEQLFDSLGRHFAKRDSLFSSTQIYLHTDKTIYTGKENIWFTAYLLRSSRPLDQYHTLHVFLSHRVTQQVVASQQFVMDHGLAAGYIFVADSFPPGDYNLIAYTNAISDERYPRVFQQRLSIRFGTGNPFTVELEGGAVSKDSIGFLAHVTNKEMLNATGASFNYSVFADDKLMKKGRVMVSPFGEVPLVIPQDSAVRKLELQVAVQKEKAAFATRIPLSFLGKQLSFRWYPESGDWINGLSTRTAFEVTDRSGKPAAIKGQLLENNRPVANLRTSSAGSGIIEFTPIAGKEYSVVLDDKEKKIMAARLPVVKMKGAVMQVKEAVVRDTLVMKLRCAAVGNKFYLLIHNYRVVYDLWQLKVMNPEITLRIPMAGLETGLATLTLFDSAFQPLAERSFLRGYDSLASVRIIPDSTEYHRRSKINLGIKLRDAAGNPLASTFSMAMVLTPRIDTTRFQDIVPYFLFRDYTDMGLIPPVPSNSLGTRADLEMLLLMRCWTRYHEPAGDTTIHALAKGRELRPSGMIKTSSRKSLKKPVELSVLTNDIQTVVTDSAGRFALDPNMTALMPDEQISLVINEKHREDFAIEIHHEADSLNKQLATLFYPEPEGIKAVMPWEEETLSKVKTLSAVVVKSKSNDGGYLGGETYESLTCHDYVCMYNILNCPNHKSGTPAVEGGVYNYRGKQVVYHCPGRNIGGTPVELMYRLKGRYYSKDFYVADYASFNPPEPEVFSTVYWSQQLFTDEKGEANVSFYTNDLTGTFSCIIEGVTSNGVVSGRLLIRVVK